MLPAQVYAPTRERKGERTQAWYGESQGTIYFIFAARRRAGRAQPRSERPLPSGVNAPTGGSSSPTTLSRLSWFLLSSSPRSLLSAAWPLRSDLPAQPEFCCYSQGARLHLGHCSVREPLPTGPRQGQFTFSAEAKLPGSAAPRPAQPGRRMRGALR